jgi:hypothetical protein
LWVILRGVKTKSALLTMRLSHSGKALHRALLTPGQEAFRKDTSTRRPNERIKLV